MQGKTHTTANDNPDNPKELWEVVNKNEIKFWGNQV